MKVRLTLVSASPRRKDLLAKLNLPFDVAPSPAHEQWTSHSPEEVAEQNGVAKVRSSQFYGAPDRVLLGADTVIHFEGRILGKPAGAVSAERMLRLLSGQQHDVITGYCLAGFAKDGTPKQTIVAAVVSKVTFRDLTKKDIRRYLVGGEWKGKAGGYAIQGDAGKFVMNVDGDYENVVGLPIERIGQDIGIHFSDCDFL